MTRTSARSDHVADAHVDGQQDQCGRSPTRVGVRQTQKAHPSPDEALFTRLELGGKRRVG